MKTAKELRERLNTQEIKVRQQWIDVLDVVFVINGLKGWTYQELANRADVHVSTVYRLWNEDFFYIRGDTIGKLMNAVGLSWNELIVAGYKQPKARKAA